MKTKCIACAHEGKRAVADYVDIVYQSQGKPVYLQLCYNHSVELFKRGQTLFALKYRIEHENKNDYHHDPLSNFIVFNSFR